MRKSKYIFIILAIVYGGVAFAEINNLLLVDNNVIFGLSVSALLISVSDCCSKYYTLKNEKNNYNETLKYTIQFLDEKINGGCASNWAFNTRNLKENLEILLNNQESVHPMDFRKQKKYLYLQKFYMIFFAVGIASFIIIPFVKYDLSGSCITSFVTLLAFVAMNIGMYIDEQIYDVRDCNADLFNDKHLIIQNGYSDFRGFLDSKLYYRNDYMEQQKKCDVIEKTDTPEESDI